MRVTQAYRKRMLEEEFQDKSEKDPSHLLRDMNAYSHEVNLLVNELRRLNKRGFVTYQKSFISRIDENLLEFYVFDSSPEYADCMTINRYPLDKYPEIKERITKVVDKINELSYLQGETHQKLDNSGHTLSLKDGQWTFIAK
jgi:hypothetical protein